MGVKESLLWLKLVSRSGTKQVEEYKYNCLTIIM
jgi:hypothetical protein